MSPLGGCGTVRRGTQPQPTRTHPDRRPTRRAATRVELVDGDAAPPQANRANSASELASGSRRLRRSRGTCGALLAMHTTLDSAPWHGLPRSWAGSEYVDYQATWDPAARHPRRSIQRVPTRHRPRARQRLHSGQTYRTPGTPRRWHAGDRRRSGRQDHPARPGSARATRLSGCPNWSRR